MSAAAALADEARCMDLADRYINSDCVKRMLQADQVLSYFYLHKMLILNDFFNNFLFFPLVDSFLNIWFQVALAEKTAVLFTKDGEQHNNLHDMQCMWCVSKLMNIFV